MNEYNTELFELFQKRAKTEDIIKFIEAKRNDLDLECKNEKGFHLMHLAALRNDLILLRFLLSSLKLNPDIISDMGFTALHVASQRGNVEIVQELLEHNADINCQLLSMGNATPLILAVQKKQKDVIEVLSKHPNINLQVEFANTGYDAMQIAISSSHDHDPVWLEIVKTLHEAGISILPPLYIAEDKTIVKTDSMYIAISVFNPNMVALLLELGYKNTIKLEGGRQTVSPYSSLVAIIKLIKAAKNEAYVELLMTRDIIELLAKSENVDINCLDPIGRTPIMIAFSLGAVGISSVINIIESGRCDINIKNSDGFTIIEQIKNFLNSASENEIGNLSLTEIEANKILDFIFPVESKEKLLMQKKLAPLSGNYFLQNGENIIDRIEGILILLNQGAQFHIDEKNRQISTQRLEEHLTAYLGNATLEELEHKTESGFTLLQVVIFYDFHNITKFLLGKGVAITTATNGGNTPLHYAMLEHISGINLDLLTEYIIKNNLHLAIGENIFNIVNDYKENILHIACKTQNIMTLNQFAKIKSILKAGFVDIDAEDMYGLRVIDIAIMNHNNNLVSEILTHEPNLYGNFRQNTTPLHYAASVGNLYIYTLLAGKFPEALKIEDYEGRTPLHHAAQNLHLDIIKTLAPNDYDILKIKDYSRGYTVLHEFIESVQDLDDPEYWEDVSAAFDDPTLLEIFDDNNLTPMELGAFMGKTNVIKYLLGREFDLPASQKILVLAVSQGHIDLIKYLVDEMQMDLSLPDQDGATPFFNLVYLYRQALSNGMDTQTQDRMEDAIRFLMGEYKGQLGLEEKYGNEDAMNILEYIAERFEKCFTFSDEQKIAKVPTLILPIIEEGYINPEPLISRNNSNETALSGNTTQPQHHDGEII